MDEEFQRLLKEDGHDLDQTIQDLIDDSNMGFEEAFEHTRDSPGVEILREKRSLWTTLEIVNKNHEELKSSRDWYLDQGLEIWNLEKRDELDAFLREYLRRLHNYSASVHSLISHTYTLLDRHEDEKPGLKEGYFDELREREMGTKVELLKQLRHYTQKRELPPVGTRMHMEQTPSGGHDTKFDIHLNVEEMREWDGWDEDVRGMISEWDDQIDITDIAQDYQQELNDFYEWFGNYLLRLFYDEIKQHVVAEVIVASQRQRGD